MKKILKSKFALISLLSISILIFSSFLFSKHVEASVSFNFVTKWGTMGSGNGQFNMPVGIAVDSGDNIYVGERYTNNRIQNFTSNGNFISLFNSPNGNGQFNLSDNGEAMTVDHHDHVYVSGNSAVNEFDTAGHFIKTFGFGVLDGSNVFQICNAGSTCRDGIDAGSNLGSFSGVGHIAVDDQDNVYVPDWNYNVIQKFTPTGTPVFRFGGNFDTTVSVAIDSSGNIYTTDYTMYVQKFDSNGNFITSWGGYGSADGQFNYPSNIAIDSTDLIYVFDSGNNRIEVFDTDGNFITKFGSRGSADGQIRGVVDKGTIAIDSHDNIYITDFYNYRVQEFTKVISQNRSLSVPPKLELRIVDNASANTAGVINTADNTASAPPATAATSLYLSSSNTTQGISIYWAGDTLASPNNTLDPNKCSAYTDVSGSSWSWGGPAYTGTSIAPTTVWSTPIVDHPTIPTTYYVSCASSVGGPTLIASITVTPAIVAPTPSTALSLQIVNGTSAPVFSNSNNTTPTPYPTPMTIPLGSSIDISWAGDTLASPNNTLDPNKCNASTFQGGGNWNWGGPAYTGTSFVNNIYSTAITDTPTVPTTYYVSCNSAVGGPLLISSILVTPTSVATGDVLVLKVTESNTTNTISNPATTTTPVPVDRSISVAQSNGVSISWAGIPSTLYYPKCFAGSSNGGSWSWAGWNSGGATLPSNFSPIIMDHPTVPTKYYVSCSDIVSGTTYSSEIIVTPVAGAPVSPALSLQIVNGTSAPVFSNSNNTTPTPYPTPMTIPLGSSIDISWAGDTLASPNNTLDPNKCNASTFQGGGNWNWGGPAYTGTSFVNNIYSAAITDTPTVPTTYYVSCNSAVGGPLLQSTIIVTPVAGSSASPALKLRIVENSNISNDIINTATNASSTPATLPMTTAQPGSAISIYWAADDTSTLYYPKCVASSSASNNWNWVSGWTGATITPLVWGGPISDSPTVATTYTVFCPSQVSGPDLTASITVTPKGATNNTQSCTGASSGGALTGWAWSDNVGWIKMDGVVYDTAGNFSGYAWADTVGWIRFGGLSGWPSGGGTLSSNAVLNTTIGKIGGWAQVLSMAGTSPDSESFDWADGWISLYSNGTDVSTPYTYGPAFNLSTGNAITPSYAWGGNVTGWVDFSQVRLIPCTVKSAKLELMIKDNSNPTNTITATANQAPNGPNASGSATLVINSAHSFDISWAGDDRTTMFYPKCTASTSSPSTNSWTWTGWLSNTGATITPLSWGHHIQNTDQITSTQKYVITCPSLISTGTTLTAVIQVKPIICDVGSTDPACSNTSDVSSLNINAPQNACGGGHYKPLLISLTGHGVTTGAQCTASISPALSINNHPEWTGNLSYSSVPNSYMLAFPSNNTNNTIPYTLNLSCPTTAALPNPADTSISPNHPTVINLLSTQDCNPGITEFYPTYPCVNPPIGENVPTMQVNVSAHGMSSCVVTDTVNGHDYPVTFNQPGMGTATVDVFGNNPNYTLSCTGNDNGTYVNTDFTDANGVPLNDFTIETTDQCSGTNPIIPPKPRPVFIER